LGIQENENPKKLSIDDYVAEQLRTMKTTPQSIRHVKIGGQPAVVLETTNSSGMAVTGTYTLLHNTNVVSFIYQHQTPFDATLAAIVESFHAVNK
jgi:hypothetical protein